jgi:hypothetical protein
MMTEGNMRIWDALSKTDPKHTKPFNRSGGFKGTAIKPIWIVRQLTEQFGPAGIGWGINEPKFDVVHADGEILVYCTVSAWHGDRDNRLFGVGGDKVQAKRQGGSFCDDEAFKKAYTDAVNNAFKFIGVGADIHMGMFEDDKYVTATKAEFAEREREETPLPAEVERMLAEIRACGTIQALKEWKVANAKAADATGHGAFLVGEWNTRKAGLEQVAAYASG